MNLEVELLKLLPPIFNALDRLIENGGVYLYVVFVWLALAVVAWIISGGLRTRMKRNTANVIPVVTIIAQRPRQPEPPIVDFEVEQTWNDDESTD